MKGDGDTIFHGCWNCKHAIHYEKSGSPLINNFDIFIDIEGGQVLVCDNPVHLAAFGGDIIVNNEYCCSLFEKHVGVSVRARRKK